MSTRPSPESFGGTRPAGPRASSADRAARVRFRRAVALMLMTLVLPGSAQLVAGDRRVGRIALRVWLVLVVLGVTTFVAVLIHPGLAFTLGANTLLLGVLRLVLVVLAIGWAALFVDAWRLGQPLSLQQKQRLAVVGLNGFLSFTVAGALLFGAHLVSVQRDLMITMFGDGEASGAHDGRFNILLLGGDSGAGRWGLRPDSMTVASIDARTGRTVLIGLPRNMEDFPFAAGSVMDEQFPHGFKDCKADECYLNSVATWAVDHRGLFPGSKHPGVDATVMAIEGITGLKINYWAMVNLEGFKDLVNAVGGVRINVRDRIPVGGLGSDVTDYIEPGVQRLNGFQTLWFARAREGSDDYSRMARQKCVMNAMLQQVSPQTAVRNFEKIAKASTELISTSVPRSEVDNFVSLALKAKSQPIATVSLVPPMINTADPDMDVIRTAIEDAIDRSEDPESAQSAKKKHKKKTQVVTGGSLGSRDSGYAANQADDLAAAC